MANLANIRLAVNQHMSGVTGDRTSSLDRAANTPSAMGNVASNWYTGMSTAAGAFRQPVANNPDGSPPSSAQAAVARGRQVQAFAASVMGALSMPQDMLNVGFANLTAPIAAVFPSLPAATITMLYVGVPHAHSHPPSLIPPAPPVPLPSIGTILLGTSLKTLINGMPAARCGDIGLALTCVGFFPFFQLKTGSSNTFIGGNRAARMLDICQVCSQADEPKTFDAGKIMGTIGSIARGAQKVMEYGGLAVGAMDIAASAAEAATEDDAAMSAAKGLAAAMAAAQMAADLATKALTKTMGKDPGIPPSSSGAVVLGHPNVLIGGFPMVNIPNPVDLILGRLARYKRKPPGPDAANGQVACPTCQGGG